MRAVPKTKKGKAGKMADVMHEFKTGALRSGSKSGPKVKSRKQAIAIGLKQSGQSKPMMSGRGTAGSNPAVIKKRKK